MGSDRAATGPLRVGVVLESISPARWIEHALQLIADGAVADLTTAIIVAPRMATPAADWTYALYRLFVVADRRVFRRQPDPLAVVDISRPLNGVAIISIGGEGGLPATARIALEEAGLDVMLCFGSGEAGRNLAGLVRFGVWYFPDIVSDAGTGRPLWFDATVAGRDVVTTSLNELTAAGTAGRMVYSAVSAVNRYSPHYTDRRIRWKMATFPARALEKLARTGADAHDNHGSDTGIRETSIPRNVRMLRIMARLGARQVAHAVRSALYRAEWSVAFRAEPDLAIATLTRPNGPGTYTFIDNPPDRFWADPFPVQDGERHWLFVEEFPHAADRAHLSVMPLHQDGTVGVSTPVLTRPYHLSYPFVFRWRDDWYMVPETLENRTVDLYRSTRFPYDWTHAGTLLEDVAAVDATLIERDGRWWMFTTIAPFGGSENDELHIYLADTPLGPWRPHPRNPQTSDARGSRPAGRIFSLDGAWYRPAQDCSRRYGYAMTIHRIVTLTEDRYVEEVAGRIEPTWARGLLGTHTFNHVDGMTLVDGERWRPRFRPPVKR